MLTVFVFLCWTYLTKHNTLQMIMLLQMAEIHAFCGWVILRYTYIHSIFFIHSSVDGHLGCFHILAIINSATNIGVHESFRISVFVFFSYVPRSGVARSYGSSIFSFFEKPLYCFPQWLHQFTFLLTVCEGVPFLHILTRNCYLWSFWW